MVERLRRKGWNITSELTRMLCPLVVVWDLSPLSFLWSCNPSYLPPDDPGSNSNNQLPECGEYDLPILLSAPELFINCADIEIEGFGVTANGGSITPSTANGNSTSSSTENGNSNRSSTSLPLLVLDSKRSVPTFLLMMMLVGLPLVFGASW